MIYRGQVSGDVIVLADGVRLPEGCEVLVELIGPLVAKPTEPALPARNGVPIFAKRGSGGAPNLDLVNELRDDAP